MVGTGLRGLDALLDQGRDHVRHRRMELVARPEEVRGDQVGESLAVLVLVDLCVDQVRLLGDPVRGVGLLGIAVPQIVLGEGNRRELRIGADRADEHGLVDPFRVPGGFDHMGAHQQVRQVEPGGVVEVVADSADVGSEVDDHRRIVRGEHCFCRARLSEIELTRPRRSDIGPSIGKASDHAATQETGPSGDDHPLPVPGAVRSVMGRIHRHAPDATGTTKPPQRGEQPP